MDIEKLKQYFESLKKEFPNMKEESLLEIARGFLIHEAISMEKQKSVARVSENANLEATDKQINFLKREDVNIPKNLTKKEASQMISEIIKHKEKKGSQEEYL